ncbi:MAG: XrtA system polysaccharide chain length determinant [Betaproteobacteria bacterium]
MNDLFEQLISYLKATWRYRWHAVIVAWIFAIGGWIAVASLPDRYSAAARVYVDTQSILRPLLAGLAMQPNVTQIVDMMSKTLISRPNVEKVIGMANMDSKLKTGEDREQLVTRLSKELTIRSSGAQNFYTIAYADQDPQQAKRVVQSLLTIFVEGSMSDKVKDSESARTFIDDQLKNYGERLTAAENAVTEFKRRNAGLMPGQGQNFYSRLGEAQIALNQAKLDLAEAEQGRDAIKRRFTVDAPPSLLDERLAAQDPGLLDPVSPDIDARLLGSPELDSRILTMQQKLDTLRLTFTDKHPDIAAILPILAQLREQKQREREQKQQEYAQKQREAAAKSKKSPLVATQNKDPVFQQLSISMAEYDANVASLSARVAEFTRRYGELKAAANAIPQVEAEFTQLTRDYDVTKKNYEQLVGRRETAQITGDMQSTSSVMDFRVVDPPQVLAVPEWPNRPFFLSIVFLGSLVAGVGFSFVMSQLRPTVNTERGLLEVGELPVFGTVIMAWSDAQKRKQRKELVAVVLCMFGLLFVYAATIAIPIVQRSPTFDTLFRPS